jgi:BRCA1 C Terminus (BRCT) domain/twin BRCT domain
LQKEQLTPEKYMFIFEKFEGSAFIHIENMKNKYALGVKCVLSVLNDEMSIQADYFHFYTLCMKDLFLSFSSVTDPKRKAWLSKVVHYMGGLYGPSLSSCTTHLVTDDVFSKKIPFAIEHNVKIMRLDWIQEIWNQHQNIDFTLRADDDYFNEFKLPIFNKLIFTTTGIDVEEKRELMKMIEDNGGVFSQVFKSSTIKVLITTQNEVNSAKYKAAMKYDIHCLSPEWVRDSISAGYALQMTENYVICAKINAMSTPEKVVPSIHNLLPFDNTMLSDITTADFTQKSITLDATTKNLTKNVEKFRSSSRSLRSSLQKPSTSSKVDDKKNDTFKKPALPVVRDTIELPPPPQVYAYNRSPAPSTIEFNTDDESIIPILTGKRVFAYGFKEDNEFTQITNECEKYGAHVVDSTFSKQIDYIITPSTPIDQEYHEPQMKHLHIVNDFWLEESIEEGRCLEPKFYHFPLFKSQITRQVLKNEMFVLTNYKMERERPFIKMIIKCLGGDSKEHLNKNDDVILISPSQEGRKYLGAKGWDFTVLRAEWFYACYKHQTRYDETEFLVGDVPISKRNKIDEHSSMIPFSQETDIDEDMKEDEYIINRREIDSVAGSALPKRVAQLRGPVNDSPKTPTTMDYEEEGEVLSISKLCEDMPTPQRELTKAVLREADDKNQLSPRAQRQKELLKTPGMTQKFTFEESSPMPPTPDCMRKPPVDYSLRPDSSPDSQWFWKQKFESLDRMYEEKTDSSRKARLDNLVTPPYQNTRHDFFKKRIPQYHSPDPRDPYNHHHHTAGMSQEAANFFDDSERIESMKMQAQYDKYEKENMEKRYSIEEKRKIGYVDDYVPEPKNELIWLSNTQRQKEIEELEIEASKNKSILASISNQSRGSHIVSDEQQADSDSDDEESESPNSEYKWLFAVSSRGSDSQVNSLFHLIRCLMILIIILIFLGKAKNC